MDFAGLMTAILTNGVGATFGAAILYFSWYRETKTYPALMATFAEAQKMMQDDFAKRNAATLEVFTTLTREERTNYQRWHEENRDRLDKLLAEMRDQRHLVRDLAHQLGLRQAVADKERESHEPKAKDTLESKAVETRRSSQS